MIQHPNIDPLLIKNFKYSGNPIIRFGTIIYPNVKVGNYFDTGHNVIIRSGFECGSNVSIGTNTVIDGNVHFGNFVKVSTGCYLPPGIIVGNRVFLGPNVTFTNDAFPLKRRDEYSYLETKIGDNVSFGAGSVILPGLNIGKNCFIAAGSVVTKDVPENTLVIGHGLLKPCPESLLGENNALSWKEQ